MSSIHVPVPSTVEPPSDAHPTGRRPFAVSVVQNTGGKLCKVLSHDTATGHVAAKTDAFIREGRVREVSFESMSSFMSFRSTLPTDCALMMGKPLYPDAKIVTQKALEAIPAAQREAERVIARDRAHMSWPDGPTVIQFDLDRPDAFPPEVRSKLPTTPEGWRDLLISIFPGLARVPMAWAPSSSSFIYLGEKELHGLRGQRFYTIIGSGVEVPRFKEALHDALVSRGMVWYEVSKSGSLLKRFPFDLTVYQPEHLDFAAGPECVAPLESRPPMYKVWEDAGSYLAASDLPVTSEDDRRRVAAALQEARKTKLDEARAVRKQWIESTVRTTALRSGLNQALCEEVAAAAVERGVLLPQFLLTDSDGASVCVGELLENPAKHSGRRFHDPLEPDYRDDPRIAVFQVNAKGEAWIYSHAHGGQSWRCRRSTPLMRLGLIHTSVDRVVEALQRDDCGLYRNGDALVCVSDEDARMQPVETDGLGLRLQRHFKFERYTIRDGWIPANVPQDVLRALLTETPNLPVPKLNAVTRGPFALGDGTVIDTPGYDPASQVIYAPEALHPRTARRRVTLTQAEEALRSLWQPVRFFPLQTDLDRGILLAAMLSAVMRPSLNIAPGYYVTAHSAGTGKTLLAQFVGALQTGTDIATCPLPPNEDERRKHVFASLRQGEQCLLFDNTERGTEIDSAVLANLITSPWIGERVLGISVTERHPNRLTLLLTGNNLLARGDLNRRLLPIRLDAGMEHPWERSFDFHPVHYALANFIPLRIAALELIQWWRTSGASCAPGATAFPQWDAVVRSVVVLASVILDIGVGFADPIEALRESYANDPETDALGNLLKALHDRFGHSEFQLKDVESITSSLSLPATEAGADAALHDACNAALEYSPSDRYATTTTRLGMYLAQHEGQIVDGLKCVKGKTRGGARKWSVVCAAAPGATVVEPVDINPEIKASSPSEVGVA